MPHSYKLVEAFYSLQGEGVRAGEPSVFVRFTGCNLNCVDASALGGVKRKGTDVDAGFFCDTPYDNHALTLDAAGVLEVVQRIGRRSRWIVWTGGEPTLQLDRELVELCSAAGYMQAIETNGTRPVPDGLDWICCAPKRGTSTILGYADEVKFVIGARSPLPATSIVAEHLLLSPRFHEDGTIDDAALSNAIGLALANPPWRVSVQQHKFWGVR